MPAIRVCFPPLFRFGPAGGIHLTRRTPLHDRHLAAGARMTDFGGWDMPLHYGSQMEEHHRVRRAAGMFDVSHMLAVDVIGADAMAFLRRLLANDVARLDAPGRGLYSCMLNPSGGVVDDLIVHRFDDHRHRLVVNAGNATMCAGTVLVIAAYRALPF